MISFNKNSVGVTVFFNGRCETVSSDAINYKSVLDAVKAQDEDALEKALNVEEQISSAVGISNGLVSIVDDKIYIDGFQLHNTLSERFVEFLSQGISVEYITKFLDNLMLNESVKLLMNGEVKSLLHLSNDEANEKLNKFIDDAYSFLSHRNLPITTDGCFLAYKAVQDDWYSKTRGDTKLTHGTVREDGRILNAIGEYIECERKDVDPNRDVECSYGLHVGCLEYSGPNGWFKREGDRIVVVKVNPRDVVAVPPDHSRTKMRVSAYTVLQEFQKPVNKTLHDVEDDVYEEVDEYDDIDVYDVYEDDELQFYYTDKNKRTKHRHVKVTEVNLDDNANIISITAELLSPEKEAGAIRKFLCSRINDVKIRTMT